MFISKPGGGLVMAALLAATACGAEDTDTRPATLTYITKAIFRPSCATATCHGEHAAINGVALHDPEAAYRSLLMRAIPNVDEFVIASNPDASELMSLLEGKDFGEIPRMPPDQPLPDADIALIRKWILDGAKND